MKDRHIALIHFGSQCPCREELTVDLEVISEDIGWTFSTHDLMDEPELAKEYQIFTPLLIMAESQRIIAPLERRLLKALIVNKSLESWPRHEFQPIRRAEHIRPLTRGNMLYTCWLCVKGMINIQEMNKSNRALRLYRQTGKDFFGYIGGKEIDKFTHKMYEHVGAIEVLPANLIPYPIPDHEESTAFITCVYSEKEISSAMDQGDYRQHLIEYAIEHLPEEGFQKIQVIAGSSTAYPNGPVKIFTDLGFKERESLQEIELADGLEEFVLLEYDL